MNLEDLDLEDALRKGLLLVASLFLVFSAWGVYSTLNQMINIWIDYRYAPLFKLLLNLGVGVTALYALTRLARERL